VVVGSNLVVEIRHTQGNPQRAEALARELVQERVDVIVTILTATAMAARRANRVVPIVMLSSGFPVEGGLAESLGAARRQRDRHDHLRGRWWAVREIR